MQTLSIAHGQRRQAAIPTMVRHRVRQVSAGVRNTSYSKASTAQIDMSNAKHQSECIFYSKFPSEIRTPIFEYAMASSDDTSRPYHPDRVYYRPGYHYHQHTSVALLQTCKQIFAEARLIPVAEAEHTFWRFGGPFEMMKTKTLGMATFDGWLGSLNQDQQQAVKYLHIFTQQIYLENMEPSMRIPSLAITTKQLTLTLRRSDWWSWASPVESADKLGICPWLPSRVSHQTMLAQPLEPNLDVVKELMKQGTWGQQICQIKGLNVLRIEFEVDEVKKAQLQAVLARAKYWKFPLEGSNAILEQVGNVRESSWEGLKDLKDDSWAVLKRYSIGDSAWNELPKMRYYVAEMTWKRVSVDD